jgi:hypothetical protein
VKISANPCIFAIQTFTYGVLKDFEGKI